MARNDRLILETTVTLGIVVFISLIRIGSVHSQASSDILLQLEGLWTGEWVVETGGTKVEQVLFYNNGLARHTAALPFFPGLATVAPCQGCNGADIVVSGTGFDCRYAYSIFNQNEFAWTLKGGQGGCPPSAKFVRVSRAAEAEAEPARREAARRAAEEARRTAEAEARRAAEEGRRAAEARPQVPDPTNPTTVDEALARLKSANVAFNSPDHARVGKPIVIEAKISTYLGKQEMKVLIEEAGKVEVETLKVSDRVVATLVGGSSFDVSPTGPQEQWVSDVEPTSWTWQITPKIVGKNQPLFLTFDAIISIKNKEDKRTISTFKRLINVDVGWPETVGEWLELVKKTGENVSWIWASMLIPIVGGTWAWLKQRRRPLLARSKTTPLPASTEVGRDRDTARATVGQGLAVSAFPRYVPV